MLTSQHYTAILTAAAQRHEIPVDPVSLLDTRKSFDDHCLRARINAVVCFHLHQNHKEPLYRIARAYSLKWETIYSRVRTGRKLVKKNPWKNTYLRLP
jgi:hypothetical protein